MSETKICTMCGVDKQLDEFRKYPGATERRYPYCLECQSIETRRRYLSQKDAAPGDGLGLDLAETAELAKINQLYKMRVDKGLKTFGQRNKRGHSVSDIVAMQMCRLEED